MSVVPRIPGELAGSEWLSALGRWPGWLRLCLIEARPVVLVMFVLRYLTAAALAGGADRAAPGRVVAGAAAWLLAVLSIYLINGTTDVAEDRVNGSGRPVASGRLPLATARQVAA